MSLRGRAMWVTGGAGFISSHLLNQLISDDPRKKVVARISFRVRKSLSSVQPREDLISRRSG